MLTKLDTGIQGNLKKNYTFGIFQIFFSENKFIKLPVNKLTVGKKKRAGGAYRLKRSWETFQYDLFGS